MKFENRTRHRRVPPLVRQEEAIPLHPDVKAILDALPPASSLEVSTLPLAEAVSVLRNRPNPPTPIPNPVRTEDRRIPGPEGEIAVRIYHPASEPLGLVVNFHGGGWVFGSIANDDFLCHLLARESGCVVISVDYRLAPEARFPNPLQDCYAAVKWAAGNAEALNVRTPGVAVCGSSAGANLAIGCALKARDDGDAKIALQILLYPVTDQSMTCPSYEQNAEGYLLTSGSMKWFWDQYTPTPADRRHAYASPLAADLSGMPPAVIFAAEFDPLRDEAKAFAERLQAAGTKVQYVCYDGLIHGFFRLVPQAWWVSDLIGRSATALRSAFVR